MKKKMRCLLLFTVLVFYSSVATVVSSDEFGYKGFHNDSTLTLNGVATVFPSGILRLTNDTSRLLGRAFHSTPLRFNNSSSFSTSFVFAIVPEIPRLGGHGMTFAIAPSTTLRGGLPSQYLGLLNNSDVGNASNHIFFVEFDTVQDFEFGDINDNHVGVNLNDMRSNASQPAAYYDDDGTKVDINLKSGNKIQAWVEYDGVNKVVNVTISPFSRKPIRPLISYAVDLTPVLEESMFVGFSGSTGLLASAHYVFGWNFKMNGEVESLDLSSLPSLPSQNKKKNMGLIFGISASALLVLVLLIVVGVYFYHKMKNADVVEPWEVEYGGPHRFDYNELKKATRGFKDKQLLGAGGFGKVYKGTLPSTGNEVAVKRISHGSKQGLREFVNEIASIGRLRHRNLVQLQGWCRRREDLLLVYDYMQNGSLDNHLFFDNQTTTVLLSWPQRFKILRGVASALLYLHEEWEHVVIHRDVKASNVLLDADMNGRLGDFGLAKLYEHGANPATTRIVGTLGYLAPELTRSGRATTGSDVFAFGALILEVVCGRRPIEPKAKPEELILVDWVWEKWTAGTGAEVVVDPRLEGEFDWEEVELAVKVGLMCSHPSPAARPTMREVVMYLDGDAGVPEVITPPEEDTTDGRSHIGFDDYLHSYASSSFEMTSIKSTAVQVTADGDQNRDRNHRVLGSYSPLSVHPNMA